jgi:hypothetical protein
MVADRIFDYPDVDNQTTTSFNQDQVMEKEPRQCSDGFFLDKNATNLCRPLCGEFRRTRFGVQVLENTAICVCLVASVIMLILALTVQRDSL